MVQFVDKKIEILTKVVEILKIRKHTLGRTGVRSGICSCVTAAYASLSFTDQEKWEYRRARLQILSYLSDALGENGYYLEDWQRENNVKKRTVLQNYAVRERWALWIIEQYKQIQAEQLPTLGNTNAAHLYEVTTTAGKVDVYAHNRLIAEKMAIKAGYEVKSVNMVG